MGSIALLALLWPVSGNAAALPLTEIVRLTMALHFEGKADGVTSQAALLKHLPASSPYRRPLGVFVTLSKDGKPRACWGSPFPQYKTVQEATVYATLGALTKEYRYRPVSRGEWKTLKWQVTVVKAVQPIEGLQGQNPLTDGLMVRQGGRSGVMLPGEARDATYQLVQCKLKAGIQPGQTYQLYRIIADVYQ